MNIHQTLQDISSNLNRIVNFYIRGSKINLHFIDESIHLLGQIKDKNLSPNLMDLFKNISSLLQKIKEELSLNYLLADDALTYSSLLSIHARKYK